MNKCQHLKSIEITSSEIYECAKCIKLGDSWVHLRLCTKCGSVGCCDNSKNKHATKHYKNTSHPLIKSQEKGEDWGYCFEDELYLENFSKITETDS